MRVGVIDYGLGNITSVCGAVDRLGHEAVASGDPDVLGRTEKLILPGVGAFKDGLERLRSRGLVTPLTAAVCDRGTPILGICLGAQLMTRSSEEFGRHDGLGWVEARVRRLAPADRSMRVPHVGWNDIEVVADDPLFAGIPSDALFYYVHTFAIHVDDPKIVLGTCDYGGTFVAAYRVGNICATQFHPEKSQKHGLTVLENFLTRI